MAEADIYSLALLMQKDPAEIREWDVYDRSRLLIMHWARIEARMTLAARHKMLWYEVPEIN